MHRSGGAGEGVEEDDGDDGGGGEEQRDYHQIGEGARRHIRVVGRLLLLPRRRSSPPAGLPELAKTPTQSGERSEERRVGKECRN